MSKARVQRANRDQFRLEAMDLDGLVEAEHRVRSVWAYVEGLDLSSFYAAILAREGEPGRAPIDPAILICLWLYGTLEGIGSARQLALLAEQHHVYRWICGGVGVNHHTLSDFRVEQAEFLDRLLTQSLVALMQAGVTSLEEVAQDGMRTRASAGSGSFRRRATLEAKLAAAEERVARLKREVAEEPAASSRRRKAAQERAAREAKERAQAALQHLAELEKRREREKKTHKKRAAERPEPRASLSDPEARVMKMADGGFRPAYNLQQAMDSKSGAVVGVAVSNSSSDRGEALPMLRQVRQRAAAIAPRRWLADTGYADAADIEAMASPAEGSIEAYIALPAGRGGKPATKPRPAGPVIQAWRQRMQSTAGQQLYKRRCLAEWVNAGMRNRGLRWITVRGMAKARAVLLWQAVAHNFLCLLRHGLIKPAAA